MMEGQKNVEQVNETPKAYQEAFMSLGNELIFTNEFNLPIAKHSVITISRRIQKDFMDLDRDNQKNMSEGMFKLLKMEPEKKDPEEYSPFGNMYKETDEKFLKDVTYIYTNRSVIDQAHMYGGWGFTPKLAKQTSEETKSLDAFQISQNCFGIVEGLAGYYHKKGLRCDMGITADHPFVVVYMRDGVYLASNGGLQKIHGELEEHGGYKIYRPVEEDRIPHRMIMIHDFDKALVYEVLENMEVLRHISLGEDATNLPDTYESGKKVAEKHKDVLQKMNWKDLQKNLFPEIDRAFAENKTEWEEEIRYVGEFRNNNFYSNKLVLEATKKAQEATGYAGKSFEEGHAGLFKEARGYRDQIISFLQNGTPFESSVPENIRSYFTFLKNAFDAEENLEYRKRAYQTVIERIGKILDKNNENDIN